MGFTTGLVMRGWEMARFCYILKVESTELADWYGMGCERKELKVTPQFFTWVT